MISRKNLSVKKILLFHYWARVIGIYSVPNLKNHFQNQVFEDLNFAKIKIFGLSKCENGIIDTLQLDNFAIFSLFEGLNWPKEQNSQPLKWQKRQFLHFKNPQNWFHVKSEWWKNAVFSTLWNLGKPFLMDFFSIFPEFRKGCWDTTYSSSLTSQHLGNKSSVEAHNGKYFHARLEVAFENKSHIFLTLK